MPALAPFLRAVAVWLLLMVSESLQGAVRRAVAGPDPALAVRQASVVTSTVIIFVIAWFCMRWMQVRTTRGALAVGLLWVALTLAFELGLGWALGMTWREMLVDYDLLHGGLMPIGLAVMALTPWAVRRLRHAAHVISIKAAFPPDG